MKQHPSGKRVKKSGTMTTVIVVLVFVVGLSLLLYPTVSNYINTRHQSSVIHQYTEQISQAGKEQNAKEFAAAEAYNRALLERGNTYLLSDEQLQQYNSLLNSGGSGVMAYLEIPVLGTSLAIYHGTDENVLQVAVGHLEWTSLPVGGESTHCVVSGHRGLPSAELLTNLDRMELGDRFYIHVLGETLEYKVDNIAVVEPDDLTLLGITEGEDYVTLLTCTPYGINSHRLLVRGSRVRTSADAEPNVTPALPNEAREIGIGYLVAGGVLVLVVLAFLWLVIDFKRKKRKKGGKRLIENQETWW